MYVSINKQLVSFKIAPAFYLGFAREKFEKPLIAANVSAGNVTLCCVYHSVMRAAVDRACYRCCLLCVRNCAQHLTVNTVHVSQLLLTVCAALRSALNGEHSTRLSAALNCVCGIALST